MEAEREHVLREIAELKALLKDKQRRLEELNNILVQKQNNDELTTEDIVRYSRQIILPQVGLVGQQNLKKSRILIVGVGGLGCPILLYLAAAGIGCITIVDSDTVELSNIHRQVLHSDATENMPKVESATEFFKRYYGNYVKIIAINERFTPENADQLVSSNDIVIDATDNVGTRYLLNHTCVKLGKPLVSGSALGLEGQVTVYNSCVDDQRGPCYRCLFPQPPPLESAPNCSQAGVLGPVPGLIALIQTLEVLKLVLNWPNNKSLAGRMILLDANDMTLRTVKLRRPNQDCPACGINPQELSYYSEYCGDMCSVKLLEKQFRLTPEEVKDDIENMLLIDVRSPGEFAMCKLKNSYNFPYQNFTENLTCVKQLIADQIPVDGKIKVCFICRRGNDSQLAADELIKLKMPSVSITDMIGGLHNWAKTIDNSFPIY